MLKKTRGVKKCVCITSEFGYYEKHIHKYLNLQSSSEDDK